MYFKIRQPITGETLVAWQNYRATRPEELSLHEGEIVELVDTEDPTRASKRIKLDPELDKLGSSGTLLDSSAARHKLSVKPHRKHPSSRYSPTRSNLDTRWLVRQVKGEKRQGWVPCYVLQSTDEPVPGTGLPGDAAFRRQAVVKELVETEQEFVKDLDFVVQEYLIRTESAPKVPKIIKDNLELVFGGLVEISDFHRSVLMEGVKYYSNEPNLLGKAFLRLERDFDKHVNYCNDEPVAQAFLESCEIAKDYYDELSQRLGDDKTLSEHLKLPIQRINDYQLLLKELVRYSECLGEDCTNLQKALELMLSVPHRAQDDKFTNSIEGYRGSIHKLGRLIAHDWFSVTFGNTTKERYLFLFKARILISKVRRISEDRSVFQLKDIIRLPQVEIKDQAEDRSFELVDKVGGHSLILTARRDHVKELWLKEIREFASDVEEHTEDIQVVSEATSTLASEALPSDIKPFKPPQTSEAQKLLTTALKAGIEERKLKASESPKVHVVEPVEPFKEPKPSKLPQLTDGEETSEEKKSKPSQIQKPNTSKDSRLETKKLQSTDEQIATATESVKAVDTVQPLKISTEVQKVSRPSETPTEASTPTGESKSLKSEVSSSAQQSKVQVSVVEKQASVSVGGEVSAGTEEDMSRRYSGLSSSGKGGG